MNLVETMHKVQDDSDNNKIELATSVRNEIDFLFQSHIMPVVKTQQSMQVQLVIFEGMLNQILLNQRQQGTSQVGGFGGFPLCNKTDGQASV